MQMTSGIDLLLHILHYSSYIYQVGQKTSLLLVVTETQC